MTLIPMGTNGFDFVEEFEVGDQVFEVAVLSRKVIRDRARFAMGTFSLLWVVLPPSFIYIFDFILDFIYP